jgi:5-methylthioadenosine/S-adenosylhomocysteine deaminase
MINGHRQRMDADAALERLAQGIETVRKFNHPRILDAVAIEGVGTCSDVLNRGAADLAREYDSLFVLHKSTSEAEVEVELRVFGERPVTPPVVRTHLPPVTSAPRANA